MKQIIRIINADIPGKTQLFIALSRISGVGYSFSNAVCNILNMDKHKLVGELADDEVKKIEDVIKNPKKYNFPSFMLNRKKDVATGEDKHLITSDLKLTKDFDIKRLKKIRSYRGMRHQFGLPVRGQRTRSHFREGKTVGVVKKKLQPGTAPAAKEAKEKK